MSNPELDRRLFLRGAFCAAASCLLPWSDQAIAGGGEVFASAYYTRQGTFGALVLSEDGEVLAQVDLPARGHDVVFHRNNGTAVVFARRPGNFAVAFNIDRNLPSLTFTTVPQRHFYGHAVFAADGKLLFATENDYENAVGTIGVFDASAKFSRIGEFQSYGIGPHQIILMPDNRTLAVANGGIETHPDYGRSKLNVPDMNPSLAFIDGQTGDLLEKHELPVEMKQVSIRHIASSGSGNVVFAGQYEGSSLHRPQLVGQVEQGRDLEFLNIEARSVDLLRRYTGSIAVSRDLDRLAVTSPRGGVVLIVDRNTGRVLRTEYLSKARGVAATDRGFAISSGTGRILGLGHPVPISEQQQAFDNHLTVSAGFR